MYEQLPGKSHILRNAGLRLQQPSLRAHVDAPRWKRGSYPLGEGVVAVAGRAVVLPCWDQSNSLAWGGSAGTLGAGDLLLGTTPTVLPCPLGFSLLLS